MSGETRSRQIISTITMLAAGPTAQQIHSIYKARLGTFQDNKIQLTGFCFREHTKESFWGRLRYMKLLVYSPPGLT